jgi:hypothetical protein
VKKVGRERGEEREKARKREKERDRGRDGGRALDSRASKNGGRGVVVGELGRSLGLPSLSQLTVRNVMAANRPI